MISCTEFIPLYSEFFKYLEAKGGHDAVLEYWYYISDNSIGDKTNPNSLAAKCELYGGFEGAKAYWGHTLTEEACDLLQINDNKNRFKFSHMRHCPSRGMLNELKHVEPYYDYCNHCNVIYIRVLEKYGIEYIRDNSGIDNAECRSLLFEKGNCPNFDWRNISDEDAKKLKKDDSVEIVDLKTEDNKYLHRDFHLSGDLALKYCGDKFGYDAYGYDKKGFNKKGYNRNGFDRSGYNALGFDKNGFDKNGYDRNGYDKEGYDKDGYNKFDLNKSCASLLPHSTTSKLDTIAALRSSSNCTTLFSERAFCFR